MLQVPVGSKLEERRARQEAWDTIEPLGYCLVPYFRRALYLPATPRVGRKPLG